MHRDDEGTPLLRGRAAAGELHLRGAATLQQLAPDEGRQDGGITRLVPPGQSSLLSRTTSRPLMLAVAAVCAAALLLAIGLMSTSERAVTPPQGGGTSLTASAPRQTSGTARDPGERKYRDGRDERGGSKVAGGGWRSQADRSPGLALNVESGGDEGEEGTSSTKPNVFFFLIDDMGHGDIGYQSTDLSGITPNLDKLAAGGIKLTNYYSMSTCTPARASIMTGRYPVRYGMQYNALLPGAPWGLSLNEKILPQYLNEAGYESHMVGKWHLGSHKQAVLPNQRGFKSYLGYLNGVDTYYSHQNTEAELDGKNFFDLGYGNATGYYDLSWSADTQGVSCSDGRGGPSWDDDILDSLDPADVCYTGAYSTDAFVGRARQVVQAKTPFDEKPLFLYVAHQAVHAPIGPAPWDAFTPEEQDLLNALSESSGSDKRARFAGVLMFLDKRIGAFVDMLEEEGWLENSVIVVASDNGACPEVGGTNYPLRGTKSSVYEGGRKVPAFVWSKSHLPSESWGTSYDKMMHATDLLPTIASLAGAELSGSAGALDGVDHWESLKSSGQSETGDSLEGPRTEMLYNWDSFLLSSTVDGPQENRNLTQGGYRMGDWALLLNVWCAGYYSHDATAIENDPLLNSEGICSTTAKCEDCLDECQLYPDTYAYSDKLFNLREDPREEHDLYDQYPEIVKKIRERAEEVVYSEWIGSVFLDIDPASYSVWKENNWWMQPWEEILEGEQQQQQQQQRSKSELNLNGLL